MKKPINPCFSSGPCAKIPNYNLANLNTDTLGRSHRSSLGKSVIKQCLEKTVKLLNIPEDFYIAIVPGSNTGAIEMSFWNLLGVRDIDVFYWSSFGRQWYEDIKNELKLNVNCYTAPYGKIADLSKINPNNDTIFLLNATTSGVKVPDLNWIPEKRKGLVFCDATSGIFCSHLDWSKLDVLTFSWQKALGGEAAHGMIVFSPAAIKRLEEYTPTWPLPKIFRFKKKGVINMTIFEGNVINTPSMLCIEDYLHCLNWVEHLGGIDGMILRCNDNMKIVKKFVKKYDWIDFVADEKIRSTTSLCLKLDCSLQDRIDLIYYFEKNNIAYDISSYKEAPPGLRIWCGPTVEASDIYIFFKWLEWYWKEKIDIIE